MKQPQVYSQNEESARNLRDFSSVVRFYRVFRDYKQCGRKML
jgi:hypothetical protein